MPTDLQSILRIEVPMIVQIASRRMKVREVSNLAPGAIIELPKLADEELDILVSNRPIGQGTAVKVGENFGLRVTKVGDLRSRIEALGNVHPEATSDSQVDTPTTDAVESSRQQIGEQDSKAPVSQAKDISAQ